jgi:hypothetical protein
VENLSISWKLLFENRTLSVEGTTVFVHPQDRVQWRAFVNSGMSLLDPEKRDELVTSSVKPFDLVWFSQCSVRISAWTTAILNVTFLYFQCNSRRHYVIFDVVLLVNRCAKFLSLSVNEYSF